MHIVWTILIGFVVGLIAKAVTPGAGPSGFFLTAALGIAVVAIFGPTSPARNGPFGTNSIVLRSSASQTSHKRHPQPEQGLLEITPDQVIAAARQLLENSRG